MRSAISDRPTRAIASARQLPCLGIGLGADIGADHDIVGDRHAQERAHDLEGAADAGLAELMRLAAGHLAPVEQNFAGTGPQESVQQVEHRGLAGAVGADDSKDLVSSQLEADFLHGLQSAEGARQVANFEDDIAGSGGSLGTRWRRCGGDGGRNRDIRCARRCRSRQRRPLAQEIAHFPEQALRREQDDAYDGEAVNHALNAGKARARFGVERFGQRDQDHRSDHRPPDRSDAAEHGDRQRLCRHQHAEYGLRGHHQQHDGVKSANRAGDGSAQA